MQSLVTVGLNRRGRPTGYGRLGGLFGKGTHLHDVRLQSPEALPKRIGHLLRITGTVATQGELVIAVSVSQDITGQRTQFILIRSVGCLVKSISQILPIEMELGCTPFSLDFRGLLL